MGGLKKIITSLNKQPASGAFSEAWPQVEAMWREDQRDLCPSSGSGRRGRTLGRDWRAGGGGWEGPYRGWGTLFIHETFFGEGRVLQIVSDKMFPISASKQSLRLDFRPFYHQVLEDYLKLKLPCYWYLYSSLLMYDHKQKKEKNKKECLNTSAGNLIKFCCQASIRYRVAVYLYCIAPGKGYSSSIMLKFLLHFLSTWFTFGLFHQIQVSSKPCRASRRLKTCDEPPII